MDSTLDGGTSLTQLPFELHLQGSGASSGIAYGWAYIFTRQFPHSLQWHIIPSEQRPAELERYKYALTHLLNDIRHTIEALPSFKSEANAIIESYSLIATDPTLDEMITARIIGEGMPAEIAINTSYDLHITSLMNTRDPVMHDRRHELDSIRHKLLTLLLKAQQYPGHLENAIVVARSLLATDVVELHQRGACGLLSELGGISSHACIVARSLSIPMVIGVRNATTVIPPDSTVIVDGVYGSVIVEPTQQTYLTYQQRQAEYKTSLHQIQHSRHEPVTTQDGKFIPIYASVDTPDDVHTALLYGADGIGLVRTEILPIKLKRFPTEEEQYQWYRSLIEQAYPRYVTLRVFDIGSDKPLQDLPYEHNPALGLRGIRFLLQRQDILSQQLRAILRLSSYKTVRILLPMLTSLEELLAVKQILEALHHELNRTGIQTAFPQLGIMIETPAAALLAEHLAPHVNFFSVGTNDLTQYTVAADRTSELVAHIFDQLNPAVLHLVNITCSAAQKVGIEVELCGDLATSLGATELLIGMGIRAFSVAPSYIPALKHHISTIDSRHAHTIVQQVLACSDSASVHHILQLPTRFNQ